MNLFYITVLNSYLLQFHHVFSKLTVEDYQNEIELATFATKVYNNYIEDGKNTLIIYKEYDWICDKFFQMVARDGHNMSFFTNAVYKNATIGGLYEGDKSDLIIIFVKEHKYVDLDEYLTGFKRITGFNGFGRFLLVYTSTTPDGLTWIAALSKYIWHHKILRVFITFWKGSLKVYTLNPFIKDFAKDITKASDTKKQFYLEFELFDLMGYPMKIYLMDMMDYKDRVQEKYINGNVEYLGYDGKLLTQVRNVLNVTLDIYRESQLQLMTNFSKTQNISGWVLYKTFLEYHKMDIFFTAVRARANNGMANLFLHERDDYVIVVPAGEKIPEYLYIFLLVPLKLWIITSITILLVSLTIYLIRNRKQIKDSTFFNSYFDVYKIILNVPVTKWHNCYQERLVMYAWINFSVMFSGAFNSTMVSTLVVPKYYPTINTIEELTKTNLTIWTTEYEYNLLQNTLSGGDVKLLNKLAISYDINFTCSTYGFQNESGFVMRFEKAREFIKITNKIGKIRYHIVEEHPLPNAQSYLMPIDHPFLEEIQWIIHKVHESGLWYEWRKTNYGKENISTGTNLRAVYEDEPEILKLYHLQSVFYMLLIGLFGSFLVFAAEYLMQKTR